jgi:hypothetical protein
LVSSPPTELSDRSTNIGAATAKEHARFRAAHADLDGALDQWVKLISEVLEPLKSEILGAKARGDLKVSKDLTTRFKELGSTFTAAVAAQAQLDRTRKARQAQMSPDEARRAFLASIAKMPYSDRRALLESAVAAHNAAHREALEYGLADEPRPPPGMSANPKSFWEVA